jgi:hypothetical protein
LRIENVGVCGAAFVSTAEKLMQDVLLLNLLTPEYFIRVVSIIDILLYTNYS